MFFVGGLAGHDLFIPLLLDPRVDARAQRSGLLEPVAGVGLLSLEAQTHAGVGPGGGLGVAARGDHLAVKGAGPVTVAVEAGAVGPGQGGPGFVLVEWVEWVEWVE